MPRPMDVEPLIKLGRWLQVEKGARHVRVIPFRQVPQTLIDGAIMFLGDLGADDSASFVTAGSLLHQLWYQAIEGKSLDDYVSDILVAHMREE